MFMGLLEKAQQKKQLLQETEKQEKTVSAKKPEIIMASGLLEKAKQRKKKLSTKSSETKKVEKTVETETGQVYKGIKTGTGKKEVIEEKKGFGYKGLGRRQIVFDDIINEYVYEVSEPVLNEDEMEIKKEISRLFKMLADINITGTDEEEKEKYLDETLGQLVIDNSIKFGPKPHKPAESEELSVFAKIKNVFKKDKRIKVKKEKKVKNKSKRKLFSFKNKKDGDSKSKSGSFVRRRELTEEEKKSKDKIFYHIFREFLGFDRIDILMNDEGIEDISCDGAEVQIFIYHKKYDAISTNIKFSDDNELNSFVVRLAQICGKQISIYSPIVDGKLPDGSRLQTTLARTVTRPSTFTIRKFKENPLTPVDLIGYKSLSLDMAAYFWIAIEKGASILFCGGTASGKTTALNALSLFIPPQHKIVTIEDTRELNLPHKNWIAGTTRQGFSTSDDKTGKDIDMFDLIRAALRQRPKVVMVGEVRGKEAYSLFQAMATGHTSYATVHASDIHTLIQRLENPPISLPRALLTSLDVIVFQNAIDIAGKTARRMTSVTEVIKLDPDTNQLIFMEPFRWVSKMEDRFEASGNSKILNNITLQNDWTDEQMNEELKNRKLILQWMSKKNIRDYKDVGRIVSDYCKYPEQVLKKAREELKK